MAGLRLANKIIQLENENTRLREENKKLRSGAQLGPIVGACTIVDQELEIRRLRGEVERLRGLLLRYRNETPPGHQPHMIASEVDEALTPPTPEAAR